MQKTRGYKASKFTQSLVVCNESSIGMLPHEYLFYHPFPNRLITQ
jgi:hypothetical protein